MIVKGSKITAGTKEAKPDPAPTNSEGVHVGVQPTSKTPGAASPQLRKRLGHLGWDGHSIFSSLLQVPGQPGSYCSDPQSNEASLFLDLEFAHPMKPCRLDGTRFGKCAAPCLDPSTDQNPDPLPVALPLTRSSIHSLILSWSFLPTPLQRDPAYGLAMYRQKAQT